MDIIDKLPVDNKSPISPEEEEIIERYFSSNEEPQSNKSFDVNDRLKLIAIASVMLVILNNEMVDNILLSFPSMSSYISRMVFKVIVFALVLFIMGE